MNKVLISWAGNDEVESFSPYCATVNRILSFLNIDFKLKVVHVNSQIQGVPNKLSSLPAIIDGDKKILGIRNCINHFKELRGESDLFIFTRDQSMQVQLLQDWCINSLWASIVYFSYKDTSGLNAMKKKLVKQAKFVQDIDESADDIISSIKEVIVNRISEYEIFHKDQASALDYFDSQISHIDEILGTKNFIFGNEIKYIDILLYCHLNRILITGLPPANLIKQKYHRIIRWLQRVAAQTRSKDNIYPIHLEK
ncbi:glutathione S-transferase, C-terminal domain protein [Bacteriovorax sp. BAL6_X]|uniref:glutathione S-transferase C-terminal domain-containing protein n=1 Tax=Bacteriovorax sp. BAL6_X TaxID=1201290 RepID=UPI000385F223|nr:glutathione S-transferase C-terminal domain-containing protein [Bacteriovorax sp. BAL6_X]EPZ52418.1 glutathione S-transferase, C-terminal domain protein [Bacteriovorax sp. BAL6_X]